MVHAMGNGMRHTVVETPEFRRAAREAAIGFSELATIVDHLALHPDAGDLIPGTGGALRDVISRIVEAYRNDGAQRGS